MSTGRPCSICSDPRRAKLASEMIVSGATDQAVADAIGGINRMAVSRHRRQHVVAPAKALAAAAGKGSDAIEQRAQVAAAVEGGDPSAFLLLHAIATDLKKVHERLDRASDAAEQDNQRMALASLSAQLLRSMEVRAKIGGVGGYAPQKAGGPGDAGAFSINIHFSGGDAQSLTTVVEAGTGTMIEGAAEDADGFPLGPLPPALARLIASGRR